MRVSTKSAYVIKRTSSVPHSLITIFSDRTTYLGVEVGNHFYSVEIPRNRAAEMLRENLDFVKKVS